MLVSSPLLLLLLATPPGGLNASSPAGSAGASPAAAAELNAGPVAKSADAGRAGSQAAGSSAGPEDRRAPATQAPAPAKVAKTARRRRKIPGRFFPKAPQPAPRPPKNRFARLDPAGLRRALAPRPEPFSQRLERLSRGLRGAPYLRSPLGEGVAPDPDPRFRLDAFDCTTFVETAIALAYSDTAATSRQALDRLRYAGTPAFANRRHLVSSQWRPGLEAAGVVEDVTEALGGEATRYARFKLDAERWRRRRVARHLRLPADKIPEGRFAVPYLPLRAALARLHTLPAGLVVNVVRRPKPGSPDVVTHQGLLLRRPGSKRLWVRHASPVSLRVKDEPLSHFLRRYLRPRRWPIVGLNLLQVLPPKDPTVAPPGPPTHRKARPTVRPEATAATPANPAEGA